MIKQIVQNLGLLLALSSPAIAGEAGADAREQCRALVSGAYLGFMNDLDLLKNHLVASSETTFSLKARKKLSLNELKALEAKNEALKTPAADLDEELLGLRHSIETTTDSIQDADARVVTIKDQIAVKEREFKKFHELLKPVFEVKNAKIVSQGAYPIKLEYRHRCTQYLQLCPLPKGQAEALLKVAKTLPAPEACERYANIR